MPFPTFYNLAEVKQTQIIHAAIDEFYEKGYTKTSIAKIIEKANIPRGSFYQYFADKTDLYKFIILEVIGKEKHLYSSQTMVDVEMMDFMDILRQLFISGIRFYRDYPKMAVIATELIVSGDKELTREILGESEEMSNQFFLELIEERKSRNELCVDIDTEMLLFMIHSVNTAFVNYFINKGNKDFHDDDLFLAVENMLAIIKNGIIPR